MPLDPRPGLDTEPPLDAPTIGALERLLRSEGLDGDRPTRAAPWWRAGLDDARERAPAPAQAASPRNRRGATRA